MPQSCFWPRAVLRAGGRCDLAGAAHAFGALAGFTRPLERGRALDITHLQERLGAPECIARSLRAVVGDVALGVGSDSMLAGWAAYRAAPDTVGVISPWDVPAGLLALPIEEFCAAEPALGRRLRAARIERAQSLRELPRAVVQRHFGEAGDRFWRLLRGQNGQGVELIDAPESLCCTAVLPPRTDARRSVAAHLRQLCRTVERRLEQSDRVAGALRLTITASDPAVPRTTIALENDGRDMRRQFARLRTAMNPVCQGDAVAFMELVAERVVSRNPQQRLFE